MGSGILRLFLAVCCSLLPAVKAFAQPEIPAPLQPWRDWALYGEEYRDCPVLNGTQPGQRDNHICAWPGVLVLDVDESGASFEQSWTVYAETWVYLPGDRQYWPSGVALDSSPAAVVDRDGQPAIRLSAGTHSVTGSLQWITRPATVPVPAAVALVRLVLDGSAVPNPDLEPGRLWLGLREGDEQEEDRLDVRVYRLLTDGIPIRLETRLELDVAGQSREQSLVGALPAGFAGEALRSSLPAQLAPDGTLRVQLRPGSWELRLAAHAETLIETLVLAERIAPWPEEEIWSFRSAPRLRVTALEGLTGIDGAQAGVPGEWLELPAFRTVPEDTLRIVERSRNDASEPNRLELRRDLWLDFDGDGYTALDRVTGSMGSGWRLDTAAPFVMTMAQTNGENLLVTEGLEPGLQGVELRATAPDLRTTARLPAQPALAVTGYAEQFDRVDTTVHLPPSYRLFAAPGADAAAGVWIERWRLLDLFLVLIITVAAWRLFGPVGGSVALAALVLTWHEPIAPRWVWLNVLFAIAVVRVAPLGRLRTFAVRYQALSLAAVGVLLIPFLITQLRVVVYPQFERPFLTTPDSAQRFREASAPFIASELARPEAQRAGVAADRTVLEEVAVTASRIEPLTRYQPGALVQTGPGLPDWTWNVYRLSWSGPVERAQTYRMIIFAPWMLQIWRVLGVALALMFFGLLVRPNVRLPTGWLRGGSAAGAAIAFIAVIVAAPDSATAQTPSEFPSAALLEQLKERLTQPAPCHPQCAEFTSVALTLDSERLSLSLRVAAQDAVAVPLPMASEGWRPASVALDGVDRSLLYLSREGRPWLRVEPGVHEIALDGGLGPIDSFSLSFMLVPHDIEVEAQGWDVAGVVERRLPAGAIELVRQRVQTEDGDDELAATVFPPYVRVTRSVRFDLDWIVATQVERIAPAQGAFTLGIDLLPNESVLTPGVEVGDGEAIAAFTAGQRVVAWQSRLPLAESVALTAPSEVPWTESWIFTVSPMWHAEFSGFPATPPPRGEAVHAPQFFPRSGESLAVALSRPAPASGDTIAIDRVVYHRNVGARSSASTLQFEYRSTQGGDHIVTLPAGSELEGVAIDGEPVPLELDGARLTLQKSPGEHEVEIQWRDLAGLSFVSALPRVDLGGGASNLYSEFVFPRDRWVLFTYGPTLGPAILYWSELAVFVLAALVLGRLAMSPLRTHEWLLLGLGLSTFAWPVLLLFAVWAFALSWRARAKLAVSDRSFNAVQLALAALTIAAMIALVGAIPTGLLGVPDMQISSPVMGGPLSWFSDRSAGLTDRIGVVSVSLWFYKAAMLAWALWISFALLRWLRWAWTAYSEGGFWRGKVARQAG